MNASVLVLSLVGLAAGTELALAQNPPPAAHAAGGPPPGVVLPPVVRGPALETAQALAQAVLEFCAAKGETPSTVSVTDSSGKPKVVLVPDGKAFSNTATLKAGTATAFKARTSELEEQIKTDKTLAARIESNKDYVAHGGAWPLLVNGEAIGGVGVAGADHVVADSCVGQAVAKVQSRLK